jgi:hypothetical protein
LLAQFGWLTTPDNSVVPASRIGPKPKPSSIVPLHLLRRTRFIDETKGLFKYHRLFATIDAFRQQILFADLNELVGRLYGELTSALSQMNKTDDHSAGAALRA